MKVSLGEPKSDQKEHAECQKPSEGEIPDNPFVTLFHDLPEMIESPTATYPGSYQPPPASQLKLCNLSLEHKINAISCEPVCY